MKNFKLTEKEQKELCEKYIKDNIGTTRLAEIYNITSVSVRNYLKKNNIEIKKYSLTKKQNTEVINLYFNNNLDILTISKLYNVSPHTIWKTIIRSGNKIKDSSHSRRKFNINENYFNKIDSNNKAYFLGLLYADGCMDKNRYSFMISLQEKDKFLLEKLKSELEYEGELKFIKYSHKGYQNQFKLYITNKKLYKSLINLGVYPNKSLILTFPTIQQVPKKYLSHFIRGYFDGDGHARKNPNGQRYISFLGTKEFLTILKKIFEDNNLIKNKNKLSKINKNNTNSYCYKIGGNRQLISLIKFIYSGAEIYLKRKYDEIKYEL